MSWIHEPSRRHSLFLYIVEREDYVAIQDLDSRYADLELGLADCALVILARRYDTTCIISFDERHFRTVTPLQGGVFTILPDDAY